MTKVKFEYVTVDGDKCIRKCECGKTIFCCQYYESPNYESPTMTQNYCKLWQRMSSTEKKLPECINAEVIG